MTHTNDIAPRLQDYFGRQIAWFEDIGRELEQFDVDSDADAIEQFAEQSVKREKEREIFEQEFTALKREWDATEGIAAADRALIAALARRAEAWTENLQTLFSEHATATQGRAEQVRDLLNEARRGRNMLNKYRAGDAGGSTYVDRPA